MKSILGASPGNETNIHPVRFISRSGQLARMAGRKILDALLPPQCVLCGGQAGTPQGNGILCGACEADLPRLPVHVCKICGDVTTGNDVCGVCLACPPAFDTARALYAHAFPLDVLIHALKYHAMFALANVWGRQLATLLPDQPIDAILPLPLHDSRLTGRGYNQAELLARALSRERNAPLNDASLVKTRATLPQAGLDLKARQRNLRGAFACWRDFSEQTILLVDDVLTTGATAAEAARVLKKAGARAVHVATVARALKNASVAGGRA